LFSATFRYALVSLLEIAAAQGSLKAAEIARRHGIPGSYLNNVLFELRRLGLVTSKKGSNGGYRLARPPEEINLLSLHRGLAGGGCPDQQPEGGRFLAWLRQLEERWLAELERTSLADVCRFSGVEHLLPNAALTPPEATAAAAVSGPAGAR
jgi:Rrf2 family protein